MTPRTKADWRAVIDWADWFMWLIREHTPAQITKALKAATETLE